MSTPRRSVMLYIVALTAAALVGQLATLTRLSRPSPAEGLLALVFAGLTLLAYLFPLPGAPKRKLCLDTIAVFAAILLFPPALAMLIAGVGALLAHAVRRQSWRQSCFNTAQIMLQALAGGLVVALAGRPVGGAPFQHPAHLLPLAAAGLVMHLVNTLAVSTIIALQAGRPLLRAWRQSLGGGDRAVSLAHGAQLALGLLAAVIAAMQPWMLALLAFPAIAVYHALDRHSQLRQRIEANVLAEAGQHFDTALDLPATLAAVAEVPGRALGDSCLLFLARPDRAPLDLAGYYHRDSAERARHRRRVEANLPRRGVGAIGAVAAGGTAVLLCDVRAEARAAHADLAAFGFASTLCVPVQADGRVLGALVLGTCTPRHLLDERDLALTATIAQRAGGAIERGRLYEQLAGSAAELRAVLENVEQGILMTDGDGGVRFVNRRIEEFFGLDLRDLVGRPAREAALLLSSRLADAAHPAPAWVLGHEAQPAAVVTDEIVLTRPAHRVLARHCGPLRDPVGEVVGRLVVLSDITAARRRERAKDEFLAVASHELKTPLTTIGGYLELVRLQLEQVDRADPARLARYTGTAQDELARLRRLTDDLLEVARIEAGRVSLRPVAGDLAAFVREAVGRFAQRPPGQTRGQRLTCDVPAALPAPFDALRLGQVLANLLENAAKYSPAGGLIAVEVRRAGGEAVVSVRDTGIGIPAEERDRLFQPFYRATNAADGSPEGLGLGLHISRGIVEAHGGRLWVEPAPGGGSLFRMALPLAHGAQERAVTGRAVGWPAPDRGWAGRPFQRAP